MPLSNAEKQRRYKAKLRKDPEKYNEYKKKKRENYHAKKRLVADLNPKEKYNTRIIWRLRKKSQRERVRNLNRIIDITPPSSPSLIDNNLPDGAVQNGNVENDIHEQQSDSDISAGREALKRGRKKVKRDRSKIYRENIELKKEIKKITQKYEKYKKKLQRTKKKLGENEKGDKEKKKYESLSNAIKETYSTVKKRQDKKTIKMVFDKMDKSIKKAVAKDALGLTGNLRTTSKVKDSATHLKKKIEKFYNREDISRATAGRKETITKNNIKVQKRFLLDTMKNLYRTFKQENVSTKCSYYYFTKNKPYYVVKPSIDGREMCLCKTHVNPTYKAQALKRHRVINSDDLNTLITSTVCDSTRQSCMYGTCQDCCDKNIGSDSNKEIHKISWNEWVRKEIQYVKEGKVFKAMKNVKETKHGTVKELMTAFNKEMNVLKKHVYNIKIQYKSFREAIDNLRETEMVIVADFSENYNGKYHEEIQAHHFGGSREQVSLHTVVIYVLGDDQKSKTESYCTLSSCTNHQPAAIWAHLDPVLKDIQNRYPLITTVHFFTDGPFSQYRQKQNFYLCSTKPFDYGFTAITWSFFEAGHGKGPADGIGGFLKRKADDIVATGKDVSTAEQFFELLKDQSKIQLYMVPQEDVDAVAKQIPRNIKPLQGTLHVHQVFTDIHGELKYRNLGCFCKRGFCDCLQPKIYQPIKVSSHTVAENSDKNSSSDGDSDDIPLSSFKSSEVQNEKEVDIPDLCQPRMKTVYDMIYSPNSDTEQAGPSGNQATYNVGDYLLVNVHNLKGKMYRYVCIVDNLDDDGEIRVTFFRCIKQGKVFRIDKGDISYISHEDIISILPKPETETKRGQIYYTFKDTVDVFEK